MELKELEKKTVGDLREMAKQYEEVESTIAMKKEELVEFLRMKLGIEKHHVPKGIGRHDLKAKIKDLKKRRDAALAAHDLKELKRARTLIRRTKHRLRLIIEKAEHMEAVKHKEASPQPPAS
jgi:hypothetical protein